MAKTKKRSRPKAVRHRGSGIVARLRTLGFDQSAAIPFRRGARIGCSQCAPCTINGVPCHETGCPNEVFECRGCGNSVKRRGTYCEKCL